MDKERDQERSGRSTARVLLALAGFLAIAAFFLWEEHRAHLLGALPYLLVLACPFLHLFLHRGHHGSGNGGHPPHSGRDGGDTRS